MTDDEKYLFVGGPADGKMLPVSDGVRDWSIPVPVETVSLSYPPDLNPTTSCETVRYVRQYVARRGEYGEPQLFEVFIVPGQCEDGLNAALLKLGASVAFGGTA